MRLMETLIVLFFVLAWAVLCLLLGTLAASFVGSGPTGVLVATIILGLIAGGFSWMCAFMFGDMVNSDTMAMRIAVAAVSLGLFLILPVQTLLTGSQVANYMRATAPKLQQFMLSKFDKIDTDKDGTITDAELRSARSNLRLTAEEASLLEHAQTNNSLLGHVTSESTTWVPITTVVNNVPITTMSPVTTYEYGISRSDITSYPARVNERYKNW